MATGIYYFSNAAAATSAYANGVAPNVSFAIYHQASLITSVEDWNYIIVNGTNDANTGYYANPNGKVFGWTIAYADYNSPGTLETDGSWIKGANCVSGGGDVTSNRYNTATKLFLCPAFYDSASDFIAGPPVSGLVPIYIGVLHYLSGKTPITYPPDSITVSGLTNADYVVFYKTDYLYTSTDTWKVSQRFFLTGTSTPLNSLISYSISSLVDSTNVASTYTQLATVYFLKQTPLVYKMSFYANLTNATSGIANYDNYKDISGASIGRIAYSLTSNSGSDIEMVDGGSINGYGTSWNLLDSSGNAYLSNPVNFGQSMPVSASNWYLYPYSAPGPGPGPAAPCFLEGSQILCLVDEKETYLPIEQMRKGTLVKTLNSGYKMVHIIGKRDIPNFDDSNRIKDRLYKLTSTQYPDLTSDLYLTGCHSTLVDSLTEEQKDEIKKMLGVVCVTEGKYRLPASVDQKAEPWQSKGTYTVWHFALDDEDPLINFGVYANGGLVVETGSIRYLQGKANMELV